ncbi:MAG: hypothetical protein HYT89_01385 [Candidatus Omnitrophica bacterium]|nr:hypothetical protein [Candidatus Omnitrophota bacterium]
MRREIVSDASIQSLQREFGSGHREASITTLEKDLASRTSGLRGSLNFTRDSAAGWRAAPQVMGTPYLAKIASRHKEGGQAPPARNDAFLAGLRLPARDVSGFPTTFAAVPAGEGLLVNQVLTGIPTGPRFPFPVTDRAVYLRREAGGEGVMTDWKGRELLRVPPPARQEIAAQAKAAGGPSTSELWQNQVAEVHEALGDFESFRVSGRAVEGLRGVVLDLGRFPAQDRGTALAYAENELAWAVYLARLDERPTENYYFRLEGRPEFLSALMETRAAKELVSLGLLLAERPKDDSGKPAPEISFSTLDKLSEGSPYLPSGRLERGQLPNAARDLLLLMWAARLPADKLPDSFVNAYASRLDISIEEELPGALRAFLDGKTDPNTRILAERYALLPKLTLAFERLLEFFRKAERYVLGSV